MTTPPPAADPPVPALDPRQRVLWLAVRQALLIVLGAVETYLGLEHSRETRRERREHWRDS